MTFLYSCRHSGDQYRITKLTAELEVESSYLCTFEECDCPAGVRPTCRHRQMLPKFIDRGAINTGWMLDWDRGGWVDMRTEDELPQGEPAPALELSSPETKPFRLGDFPDWCLTQGNCKDQSDCILNGCALGHDTPPRAKLPAPSKFRRF